MKLKPSYISASCTSDGFEVGARPQLRAGVAARHRGEVVELVPLRPAAQRGADGLDLDRRLAQVGRGVGARHDHRGAAVARDVAVEQAEAATRSCGRSGSRRASSGRCRCPSGSAPRSCGRSARSAPSCSRVVPYSWKWRWAIIAIQIAADGARERQRPLHEAARPRHAAAARRRRGITAARPLLPCALPSKTLRKHSTCVARPDATARHASITAPSWPGQLDARRCTSRGRAAARPARRRRPAPENPAGVAHRARVGRDAVDVGRW